uniref:Uncharacterized protein n=1 Tax=Oryza rufipogon TaxID=4529 RepID=A0A0E0R881_ORYRU
MEGRSGWPLLCGGRPDRAGVLDGGRIHHEQEHHATKHITRIQAKTKQNGKMQGQYLEMPTPPGAGGPAEAGGRPYRQEPEVQPRERLIGAAQHRERRRSVLHHPLLLVAQDQKVMEQ